MDLGPERNVASSAHTWGTAGSVMRRVEFHLKPGDTLARAAERMEALCVRELPVLDDERLVGIIAQIDLLAYRGHFEWTAVRAAMSRDLVTVSSETPVPVVAALLIDRGINSVPVVDGECFVGMVSRTDCLRPLARHAGGKRGRTRLEPDAACEPDATACEPDATGEPHAAGEPEAGTLVSGNGRQAR